MDEHADGTPPSPFLPTDEVIRVVHADLFGRQRGKQFAASEADYIADGIAYSKMSLAEDMLGEPLDEEEFPMVKGHPDLHARVDDLPPLRPTWDAGSVWLLASLREHGAPSDLCARSQLRRAHERLQADLGLTAQAAGEPEFYLYEDAPGGRVPYGEAGVSYTMDRITDPRGVLARMHRALSELGIGVTALNREFSPGQFEINLRHADIETAADRAFLLKSAIKELAIGEGLQAVFMPKPRSSEEGSSLHVHISLWDEAGTNVFAATDDTVSPTLLAAIAGVQEHAAAILAFAAPTVNSYKRLRGAGLSPRTANYAEDDRYTFVRIPAERGGATRFELRAGDASASPHLLMAAILHAARDGISRDLMPSATGSALPRSLTESIAALEADSVFRDGFGDELVDVYAALKRRELTAFESAVTDWEWNLYNSHA